MTTMVTIKFQNMLKILKSDPLWSWYKGRALSRSHRQSISGTWHLSPQWGQTWQKTQYLESEEVRHTQCFSQWMRLRESERTQEQETITEQWGSERLRNHVLISQKDTFNSGNIGRHKDSLKMKYRNIRRLSVYGSSMKKKKQMIWRQKAHGVLLEWNVSRCT